jgi:hypothetical protein
MVEIVLIEAPGETVLIDGDEGETVVVDGGAIIEVVEVAEQGLPGPPGSAENIAEIVPSPILSFENALIF